VTRARLTSGVVLALACTGLAVWIWPHLAETALGFDLFGSHYELLAPEMLALLALAPLLAWGAYGSLTDLPRAQRVVSFVARCVLFMLVVIGLARPARTHDATRISAVFLVDVSDSVTDADLSTAAASLTQALRQKGSNQVQLVTFAARPRRIELPERGDAPVHFARHAADASDTAAGARTDIQAALQLAYGLFPPDHLKRIALLSDGRQTDGDLVGEATRAGRLGVRIFERVLANDTPREVAARALELPDHVAVGESFELRARVFSSYATHARLRLYQDHVLNGLDAVRDVELERGETTIVFKSLVRTAGDVAYRLEVEPSGPDRFAENNAVSATAVVPGRPRVLIADSDPSRVQELAQALGIADFDVEVRSAAALPRSLGELARYDFFILSDVPAERLGAEQMDALERYVRDLGGGFMFAGGAQSFGLGGYQGTRIEALLPLWMDSERRRDEHSLALALVIDCSGSMSGQKIELAKDAAKATADLLGPDDSLGVVGFSGEPERVLRLQSAKNRLRIDQSIARLTAQGGTAIFPALDMAFQDLLTVSARVKHVILLTDGQTQESGIPELVQAMRAEGITVSSVGLGSDVNRSLLQQAANLGAGRAYFTNDAANVPRIFVRETQTVGQNSAVEELVAIRAVEPADFLKGIHLSGAPMLRGYIATRPKPKPAQVVLESELAEPLLARWRVGLGWVLAWTSDVKSRWAADFVRWRELPAFFGQLVREHMRERRHDQLPMQAELDGDALLVRVDAIGPDDRFLNGLDSRLTITGPLEAHGDRTERSVPLAQRAPGRYEARVPLDRYGSFALHAVHAQDDRVVAQSDAQVSHPYPLEYAARPTDAALLEHAAALSGGGALAPARLFDPGYEHIAAHEELWPKIVLLALALFLIDLTLRRVRLFDRNPRG
jgi:Ca-activated chloride channel family protein